MDQYQENLSGYDEMVTCPYNPVHLILKSRFQTHLIKCRLTYSGVKKVRCPFNSTHLVNEPELPYHVSTCTDRDEFERFKYRVDTGSTWNESEVDFQPAPETSENWDDECVPSYNPQKYAANAPVLRDLKGATPSKRKEHRKNEIIRLNELANRVPKKEKE